MAEKDEVAVEGAEKPKRVPKPKPVKASSGGGGGPAAVVPWIIALALLGMCIYLFMQMNALSTKLKTDAGPLPKGSPEAQAAEQKGAGGSGQSVEDWTLDAATVDYDLGPFTANTADPGHFAKMDIWAHLESYYERDVWEAYQADLDKFKTARQDYFDFKSGKVDATGKEIKKKKGEQAMLNGRLILAAEGGEKKVEAPKMPEEPVRPLTVMEEQLKAHEAEVRDAINAQINSHSAADLTSLAGRDAFKKAVMDAINKVIDPHYGTVKDVYFKDLVTT
jgi:flagellar basal body-associated protein FliL